MALYQVNAGDRILAVDINQFYNLLKGVAASGESTTLIYNGTALIFQPSSDPSAGTRVLDIKNAAGTHLASLDFNGVLELLAAAAAPGGAVAGALYWDTLLSALRVHDGTNWRELQTVYPNLVLNSDFGRRTVFGLAMPEVFADTSAWTGGSLSVASNALTQATASTWTKWTGANTFFRDGRWSAQFKATLALGNYVLAKYVDITDPFTGGNGVFVQNDGSNFMLRKIVAGTITTVATVAQVMTLNNRYWFELEAQGTTYIGKMYSSGAAATTKAAATLLQTLSGTVADAGLATGGFGLWSNQANSIWGEQAASPGGAYVETWLPESWTVSHTGTLGGQAFGFDESADSGPLNRQWTPRAYIPAASRSMTVIYTSPDGSGVASTSYTASTYEKISGLGGSGALLQMAWFRMSSGLASQGSSSVNDANEATFTRKTATATTEAGTRRFQFWFSINPSSTATGTCYFSLPQLELGSAATAWRAAESPAAPPFTVVTRKTATTTTTSAALVEVDPRDLAANVFLPQDATVRVTAKINWANSGAATAKAAIYVDGAIMGGTTLHASDTLGATAHDTIVFAQTTLAAGKHRFAVLWATTAGTQTLNVAPDAIMEIVVDSGK